MSNDSEKKKSRYKRGPHGIGDPNDHTLRKVELNIMIPQFRRELVNKEKCPKEIEEYQGCVEKAGLFLASFKCRPLKVALSDCLEFWNEDEELFARAKKRYLDERSEYRRTGVCQQNREAIFQYLNETQENS